MEVFNQQFISKILKHNLNYLKTLLAERVLMNLDNSHDDSIVI